MNIIELNNKAKQVAEANLQKGFDWQAYLVYVATIICEEKTGKAVDYVPNTNADEGINKMLKLFVDYANKKKSYCAGTSSEQEVTEALEKYLKQNERVLQEISMLCDTDAEKNLIQKYKR